MTTDVRKLVLGHALEERSRITAYYAPQGDEDPTKRLPIVHARLVWREDAFADDDGYAAVVEFDALHRGSDDAAALQQLKLAIAKSLSAAGDAVFDWYGDGVLWRILRGHDGSGTLVRR